MKLFSYSAVVVIAGRDVQTSFGRDELILLATVAILVVCSPGSQPAQN